MNELESVTGYDIRPHLKTKGTINIRKWSCGAEQMSRTEEPS